MKNWALGAEVSKGADPGARGCEKGLFQTAWWHSGPRDDRELTFGTMGGRGPCTGCFWISHSRMRKLSLW